ncbi:hypothetical protein FRX31_006439 [Thalictrum thalictroides]|uniref:Transmembrane protein n=1 Tax=Thalictrum thalictroides TaxID=46969 RepID=A0A7J6X2S5_THATH|nr:hypothetical protein FRX31_006439 [Thalictrum thalictroides]
MLFIDSFDFTNKGHIELNVSEIYLSNHNLDFSKTGFFLFPTYYNEDRCNPNNSRADYSFDKLTIGAKSFNIVFSDIVNDSNKEEALDYSLFFLNHLSAAELRFSMVVSTSMYNLEIDSSGQWTKKNYLSAKKFLFTTLMTLISCGWSYLKPSLNLKEKVILAVVITLHSAMSVDVAKYIEIRPNCERNIVCLDLWWIFRLVVDIVVLQYCSNLSLVLLKESAKVEGKAYLSRVKIKLLWIFYFLVYFFYVLKYSSIIYQSQLLTIWTLVLLGEAITFALYMFVVYMFWPEMLRTDDRLESAAAVI